MNAVLIVQTTAFGERRCQQFGGCLEVSMYSCSLPINQDRSIREPKQLQFLDIVRQNIKYCCGKDHAESYQQNLVPHALVRKIERKEKIIQKVKQNPGCTCKQEPLPRYALQE
jgi:hypothetical protein